MFKYFYEQMNEVAVKIDFGNKESWVKSQGYQNKVKFEHKWIELAYMHGKPMTKEEYDSFKD